MTEYTRDVMDLANRIRKLTIGEMLALKEALSGDFDLPPDIGVREPANPHGRGPTRSATADKEES